MVWYPTLEIRRLSGKIVVWLLLGLLLPCHAFSAELVHEYIFLIDTSSSMKTNGLLGPLRVAVDDYADTIPIDSSSRIWIFTFDKGLKRTFFHRTIQRTKDLQDAKVFLNERDAKGKATYIFQALDGVFTKIEKTMRDGQFHDFVIHLFTDGGDNGPKKYTFAKNVARFVELRNTNNAMLELHYHALGIKVSLSMKKLIHDTEGISLIPGIEMPPKAQFSPPKLEVTDNTPVTFVNKTTGHAESWHWDFGDNTTSAEDNPTHTFVKPGEYTVQLTAANPAGRSTTSRQIKVKGGPPHAKFAVRDPQKVKYIDESVFFEDKSLGQIKAWTWDFGDRQGRSAESSPQYIYKRPGTYKVTLKLMGVYGESEFSEYSEFIKIDRRPLLKFSYFPKQPKHGQEVKFVNESVGEYKQWHWDLGDGNSSNVYSPQHSYGKEGTYAVTLSGRDIGGELETITKDLIVESRYVQPRSKFTPPFKTIDIGEQIDISDQSSGTIDKWEWNMGDGTVLNTRNAQHTFMTSGIFKVKLTVSGPAGMDSTEAEILVEDVYQVPQLAFHLTDGVKTKSRLPFSIKIQNNCTGSIWSYYWDFGDGQTTDDISPKHTYTKEGEYVISLNVIDRKGQEFKSTSSQEIKITVLAPPPLPAHIQWMLAPVVYLLCYITFRLQPFHKRYFRYQKNGERRKTYKDWFKDKTFLWREDQEYLDAHRDDYTDGFEVHMVRDWLLRKRYYFKELRGNIKAARVNQKPLVNNRLERNVVVIVRDEHEIRFMKFNDHISSWLLPHLCIIFFVASLLIAGLKYLA